MIGPPAFFISLMNAPGFRAEAVASLRLISCGGSGVTPAFVASASEALGVSHQAGLRLDRAAHRHHLTLPTTRRGRPRPTATGRPRRAPHRRPGDRSDTAVGAAASCWCGAPSSSSATTTPTPRRRRSSTTAGSAPATSPPSTPTAGSPSSAASRTSSSGAARTSPPPPSRRCSRRTRPCAQAVVVGEPDLRLGERVCAFVVLDQLADTATGSSTDAEIETVAASTSTSAVAGSRPTAPPASPGPSACLVVDALPLLGSGKPDKAALARPWHRPDGSTRCQSSAVSRQPSAVAAVGVEGPYDIGGDGVAEALVGPVEPAGRGPGAAVGVQRGAGDEAREVRRQEQRATADVAVVAQAAHRDRDAVRGGGDLGVGFALVRAPPAPARPSVGT